MRRREFSSALATAALGLFAGSAVARPANAGDGLPSILEVLQTGSLKLRSVLARAPELQLQLCYSRLDTQGEIRTEYLRADHQWFAPASLVKLPLAAMLLEELEAKGLDWRTGALRFPAMPDCAAGAADLRTAQSVTRLIERALVVSDDSAYCALFDALGPQHIATRCAELGFPGTRIQARFGFCGPELSRVTGPVWWHQDGQSKELSTKRAAFVLRRAPAKIELGRAWMSGSKRLEGPKDFTDSNAMLLRDLHQVLLAVTAPDLVPARQRYKLSQEARQFLLSAMARNPAQCGSCSASERAMADNAFRLLAVGDGQWSAGLKIHNKVGWAYGFLSDIAHLQDARHECWISCVMYLNSDGVLNDGQYDYDSIGRPFMAEAGRLLLAASPRFSQAS